MERGTGPDLLGGPEEEPPAWAGPVGRAADGVRRLLALVPGQVRTGLAVVGVLGVVAAGLLAAPAPDDVAARPEPRASRTPVTVPSGDLLTSALSEAVVVGQGGTRVLPTLQTRGVRPADQPLLPEGLRDARQLDSVVVGLAGDRIAAVGGPRRGLVGPLADSWFPALRGDAAWLVRGDPRVSASTVRRVPVEERFWGESGPEYVLPPRVQAVGEVEDGLLVVERSTGGSGTRTRVEVLVWNPLRGEPVRTLATDARALDVRAGVVVLRADPCLDIGRCALSVVGPDGTVPLPATADPGLPLRAASVRLDSGGRHLAYTRQLAGEIGDPRADQAEVVVVHIGSERLVVVPVSQGTALEEELTWADDLLLFVRRLDGPVLAAYDQGSDRVLYGPKLPSLDTVEALVGVLEQSVDDDDHAERAGSAAPG